EDAIVGLNPVLAPYNITVTEVYGTDAADANVVVDTNTRSAIGGYTDGVLGVFIASPNLSEITLIQGWDWYAGADPIQVGAGQYDLQTIVTHELGHALGLGHSSDTSSVMYGE